MLFHLQVPNKEVSIKIGRVIKLIRCSELLGKGHKPFCDSDESSGLCPQKNAFALIYPI